MSAYDLGRRLGDAAVVYRYRHDADAGRAEIDAAVADILEQESARLWSLIDTTTEDMVNRPDLDESDVEGVVEYHLAEWFAPALKLAEIVMRRPT